jgi:mevalonate kinase
MKNNQSVSVSAPGKLMLMGEHAVVYGYPCIVTAVNARIHVTVSETTDNMFLLYAPEVHISEYSKSMSEIGKGEVPHDVRFVETTLAYFLKRFPTHHGIHVETHADFSSNVGFGSSSAVVVAFLCALVKLYSVAISEKDLFTLARDVVVAVQGRASGFDVASALYGGTIYFATSGPTIEPLSVPIMPIVVGYTGVKADTGLLIEMVAQKKQRYSQKVDRIFQAIEKLVNESKERISERDWQRAGKLMDFNQEYLRDLGVSSEKLEALISAAKGAGALGAKLSGAGGGDCMIALHPGGAEGKRVITDAIDKAGGSVLNIPVSAAGVRAEEGGTT